MIDASKLPVVPREIEQPQAEQAVSVVGRKAEIEDEAANWRPALASPTYPSSELVFENGRYHVAKPQK